jgi:hypothetical protein
VLLLSTYLAKINKNHNNSVDLFMCLMAAKQGSLQPSTKATVQDEKQYSKNDCDDDDNNNNSNNRTD